MFKSSRTRRKHSESVVFLAICYRFTGFATIVAHLHQPRNAAWQLGFCIRQSLSKVIFPVNER
jgi:hypothetical protein